MDQAVIIACPFSFRTFSTWSLMAISAGDSPNAAWVEKEDRKDQRKGSQAGTRSELAQHSSSGELPAAAAGGPTSDP